MKSKSWQTHGASCPANWLSSSLCSRSSHRRGWVRFCERLRLAYVIESLCMRSYQLREIERHGFSTAFSKSNFLQKFSNISANVLTSVQIIAILSISFSKFWIQMFVKFREQSAKMWELFAVLCLPFRKLTKFCLLLQKWCKSSQKSKQSEMIQWYTNNLVDVKNWSRMSL